MSKDIGKWFEGKVQDALKEIEKHHCAYYHRFPDSHAARNYLPSQPGDHMMIFNGMPILIEDKCSEKYQTLSSGLSSLFCKKQAAFHRKWDRAEGYSFLLFCDYTGKIVECWKGWTVAVHRASGERINAKEDLVSKFPLSDLETELLKIFEEITSDNI